MPRHTQLNFWKLKRKEKNNFPLKKTLVPKVFYWHILLNAYRANTINSTATFPENKRREHFPTYKVSITLKTKPLRHYKKTTDQHLSWTRAQEFHIKKINEWNLSLANHMIILIDAEKYVTKTNFTHEKHCPQIGNRNLVRTSTENLQIASDLSSDWPEDWMLPS